MHYEDFVVQLDGASGGDYRARVVQSPAGEGSILFRLPFDVAEASAVLAPWSLPNGPARPAPHRSAGLALAPRPRLWPLEVGSGLYDAIFQGRVRTLWDKSQARLDDDRGLGLRLKIKLDPTDPATAELADLPFELLYDRDVEESFVLSRQTSLIRYLEVPRRTPPIPIHGPLRVLAVSASPADLPPLDLKDECRRLDELARLEPAFEVSFLHHASAGAMRDALADGSYHVLHFMGHGDFDPATGEGVLFFEQGDSSAERVSARTFAARLRDLRSLGLVTLNACNTGRASHRRDVSPFRGVATALVLGGLPAVVAMQHPISDAAAIGFSTAFYRSLGRGLAIDAALTEGRQAILSASPESCEWAIPVLFLRVADGEVFLKQPSPQALQPGAAPRPALARGVRLTSLTPRAKAISGATGSALIAVALYFGTTGARPSAPLAGSVTPGPARREPRSSPAPVPREPSSSAKAEDSEDKPKEPTPKMNSPLLSKATRVESRPAEGADSPAVDRVDTSQRQEAPGLKAEPRVSHDSSALTSKVTGIDRGADEGLRVIVAFRNNSDLPLSVALDKGSSILADDLGRTHSILGVSLPATDSRIRIDLPPRGSIDGRFEFAAPEFKARTFRLILREISGDNLAVTQFTKPG